MNKWKVYLLVLLKVFCVKTLSDSATLVVPTNPPEDAALSFQKLAVKYAGSCKDHDVTTEDGYILKLFNIPGDKTRPVLLIHGIVGSSDDFIVRGNSSLPVQLARAGYDVWLTNSRGNMHSRKHVTLVPEIDRSFWNFSFHEHGNDIASSIDFILQQTGQKAIKLVGLSQGATSAFTLTSTRPEYNDKIKVFVALAPVVYFTDVPPNLQLTADVSGIVMPYLDSMGIDEIGGHFSQLRAVVQFLCTQRVFFSMCLDVLIFPLVGFDPIEFEHDFIPILFGHALAGTTRKNLMHYMQLIITSKFQRIDNGLFKNIEEYGSWAPPLYDFSKITMDTYILSAKNDKLAPPKSIEILLKQLTNCKQNYEMESSTFNHVGFLWGKEGHQVTFNYISKIFDNYN
jgi:lysosomal acid lipase/cholesteryl ester hydrolase